MRLFIQQGSFLEGCNLDPEFEYGIDLSWMASPSPHPTPPSNPGDERQDCAATRWMRHGTALYARGTGTARACCPESCQVNQMRPIKTHGNNW